MENFGLYLGAIVLLCIALLGGGCSLFFMPLLWQDGDLLLWLFWASGFVVALFAALLAVKLFRKAAAER